MLNVAVCLRMALLCQQQGKFVEAEALYQQALGLESERAEVLQAYGLLCFQCGRFVEAQNLLARALQVQPNFVEAWNNLGVVKRRLGDNAGALWAYDQALQLRENYADAWNNRGAVLQALRQPLEALIAYDKALALAPDMTDAHNNRGVVLQQLARFDEALVAYQQAIVLDAKFADAHWNLARCCLLLGDYEQGWQAYEWRWQRANFIENNLRCTGKVAWQGETGNGRTLLLYAEQGLGDTLQFLRYLPLVLARGWRVVLEVQAPLVDFLQAQYGVSVIARGDKLPHFHRQLALLSLPKVFATRVETIPLQMPLSAAPEKLAAWARRVGVRRGLRVGLVWSGNPAQQENDLRSLPLHRLLRESGLQALPGAEFFSLQKELRADAERALVAEGALQHFGEWLNDFSDTAALVAQMDVVISVCTSVAHLAGVMDKPVWVLLHAAHDWRWLRERSDSPWYPSARLYRQVEQGDWAPVLSAIRADCQALLAASVTEE